MKAGKKHIGVTREKATALIREMVARADAINCDPQYLYRVTRLEVFGSYLSDKPKLGDIDIAVELKPKLSDEQEFWNACSDQWKEAPAHFDSVLRMFWPQEKVHRALKARHCAFSIHECSELERMKEAGSATGKLLYAFDAGKETPHERATSVRERSAALH